MKRCLAPCLLVLAAAAALAAPAPATRHQERILSYNTRVTVQEDGLLAVRETIKVHATGQKIKRGIYRDIPTIYPGPLLTRKTVKLIVRSVQRDGKPEPYHIRGRSNGRAIYIGKESVLLRPGDYTYTITYTCTITYENASAVTVTLSITDTLPPEATYIGSTPSGTWVSATNVVSWTIPSQAPGISGTIVLTVTAPFTLCTRLVNRVEMVTDPPIVLADDVWATTVSPHRVYLPLILEDYD